METHKQCASGKMTCRNTVFKINWEWTSFDEIQGYKVEEFDSFSEFLNLCLTNVEV